MTKEPRFYELPLVEVRKTQGLLRGCNPMRIGIPFITNIFQVSTFLVGNGFCAGRGYDILCTMTVFACIHPIRRGTNAS